MSQNELTTFQPTDEAQLKDAITWAISDRKSLYLQGGNSKANIGRPTEDLCEAKLSMASFSGIREYESAELIMRTGAATTMKEVEAALAETNQMLAFEPMDYSALLGLSPDDAVKSTIGGIFACNLAGPRRISAGSARDHLLGFQAISGRGEAYKSGGQVMKNVTGYDLSKLMAGSWGTLGAMHETTFKVLPKPETSRTILITDVDHHLASHIMSQAMQTSYDVSGATWLPANLAKHSSIDVLRLAEKNIAACRLEGPEPSVKTRLKSLRDMFSEHGKIEELHEENSEIFWREIRDVIPFAKAIDDRVIWKASVAPTDGAKLIDALSGLNNPDFFMDWAGGLVWIAVDAPKIGSTDIIRNEVNKLGGHATLIRGSHELRLEHEVFHPQAAPLAALSKRIKDQFDPLGILNTGRMYANHQKREG
ncbi:glycolate oxidase subunit GlcE [Curvivirga sp.]|uniref:glycolate oxidase subunit GlcE n=1 Tax=Curvivirga sp. TaxID=2856848 RepID=UPI003B58BA03